MNILLYKKGRKIVKHFFLIQMPNYSQYIC